MANKFLGMTGLGVIVDKIKEVIAQLATKQDNFDCYDWTPTSATDAITDENLPAMKSITPIIRVHNVNAYLVNGELRFNFNEDSDNHNSTIFYMHQTTYNNAIMATCMFDGEWYVIVNAMGTGILGAPVENWKAGRMCDLTPKSAYNKWLTDMSDPTFVEKMDEILMGSRLGEAVGYTHASWTKYWNSEIRDKVEQMFGAGFRESDALFYSYLAPYSTGGTEADEITADEVAAKFNS